MEILANAHPGEVLLEEFLKPMNITAYKRSKDELEKIKVHAA